MYSHLQLGLPRSVADATLATLQRLQLPVWDLALNESVIFDGLEEFRQHLGGDLTITLLKHVGMPIDVHSIDHGAMRDAMAYVASRAATSASTIPSRVG